MKEIVRLHRMALSIISNRGTQFTSTFWSKLHDELGAQLTLVHPFTQRLVENLRELSKC